MLVWTEVPRRWQVAVASGPAAYYEIWEVRSGERGVFQLKVGASWIMEDFKSIEAAREYADDHAAAMQRGNAELRESRRRRRFRDSQPGA